MQNVNYLCALTHTYTRNSNKMYFLENCYNKISINNSKKKKEKKPNYFICEDYIFISVYNKNVSCYIISNRLHHICVHKKFMMPFNEP